MARRKCSVLLLLCATCTLASASIEGLLNVLNEDASASPTQRNISNNYNSLIPDDYTNIVEQFANSVDLCNNAYSIACDNSDAPVENKAISLETVRKYFLKTLNDPIENSDLASLKIEKQLFKNCMKLGKESPYHKERIVTEFENNMNRIWTKVAPDWPWQTLDILLSSLDFDHFFYDIKVESHPDDIDVNVITLQPPSYIRIKRINELIRLILDSINDSVYDPKWNIWNYFKTVKSNYNNEIKSFFSSLIKIMSTSLEESTQKSRKGINKYVEETTLASWQMNNNLYKSRRTAQINWTRVISEEFKNVETEISSSNTLIVKNKNYFLNLYELLNSTENELIFTVIWTSMLAELLPYADWNSFHALKRVNKVDFCFKETKLYATSFVTLEAIRKDNINGFSAIDFNSSMFSDMIRVMLEELQESETLSATHEMSLEDEFYSIFKDAFGINFPKVNVADIYTDYEFVGIYFRDILNYRKMIRMNELNKMDDDLQYKAPILDRMYSIIDLHKPSNRFLTKLLTINTKIDDPMKKEIFYSKYAPDITQFFYSLLNENKFLDYKHHFKGDELELHTYPVFASQTVDCHWLTLNYNIFENRQIVKNMMTSMFGLHFAYKMILLHNVTWDEPESGISKWISPKKMFFISYLKNHCSLGREFLDEIISRLDEAHTNLCKNHAKKRTTCKQEPFEIQSKSIFLWHSRPKDN